MTERIPSRDYGPRAGAAPGEDECGIPAPESGARGAGRGYRRPPTVNATAGYETK